MIAIDLLEPDLGNPVHVLRTPKEMFPGLDEEDRKKNPEIRKFWLELLIMGSDTEGRMCLALVLTRGLVEQLAGILEWQASTPPELRNGLPTRPLRDQRDVVNVVKEALTAEKLDPGKRDSEIDLWRASRLSLVLSCAPGLVGKVAKGFFTFAPFNLSDNPDRKFPHMPGDSWVIRCLGGRNA